MTGFAREIRVFMDSEGRAVAIVLDPADVDKQQAAADLEQAATILRGDSVTVGASRMTSTYEARVPVGDSPWVTDHRFEPSPVLMDLCAFKLPPTDDSDFRLCGLRERDHHLRAD